MNTIIRNSLNARTEKRSHKVFTQPSKTVPDQTMSLRELLERYSRGIPLTSGGEPIYHGDEIEMPDIKKMDLSEIADLRERVTADIAEQRAELLRQQKEVDDATALRKQQELFEQWKKAEQTETIDPKSKSAKSGKEKLD